MILVIHDIPKAKKFVTIYKYSKNRMQNVELHNFEV